MPRLKPYNKERVSISSFGGIDRRGAAGENEFSDTYRLCSREHPCLTTAPTGYVLDTVTAGGDRAPLFFLHGDELYYYAHEEQGKYRLHTLTKSDWNQVGLGEGICGHNIVTCADRVFFIKRAVRFEIVPQRMQTTVGGSQAMGRVYDIEPISKAGAARDSLLLSLFFEDGAEAKSGDPDSLRVADDYEFSKYGKEGGLYLWKDEFYRLTHKDPSKEDNNVLEPVTVCRIGMKAAGMTGIKAGDYVRLSDIKFWQNAPARLTTLDRFIRIDMIDDRGRLITEPIDMQEEYQYIVQKNEGNFTGTPADEDIKIDNGGNELPLFSGQISAMMPDMDYVCAARNRVWGCSSANRAIYASELGNGRNWSVFEGLSSDSYAATIGTSGDFTSVCTYQDCPVFFKENEMIVVSGTRPASFTLHSYPYRGVAKDSPDGVCVMGDVLYYKAVDGIYAYNGSQPVCISEGLGDIPRRMSGVVMGCEGDCLYISGTVDGAGVQYVYDTLRGIWHKHADKMAYAYIHYPDATLGFNRNGSLTDIVTVGDTIPRAYPLTGAEIADERWYWESACISRSTTNRKYLSRISLDMTCTEGCDLYIAYDGGGFESVCRIPPHNRGSRDISIYPRACHHFRLAMRGRGFMQLYNITKEIEEVYTDG